jgi:PAS domain S-box-containing protein
MRIGALDYIVKSETALLEMPQIAARALRQWQHVVERRRAEQALRESEARYRLITENANDIISLLDQEGAILYLSPSAQLLLGYEPSELLGRLVFDLIHPEDLDQVRVQWARLDVHQRVQLTYRVRHSNGSWRWFDAQGSLSEQQGGRFAVVVSRDITERRQLEAQLFQSQKLEAIGQLAGGVAHDFNNLLTAIRGYGELMMDTLGEADARREDMGEILKAADSAAGLTRQLLAFSRRERIVAHPVALDGILAGTEKMLRRVIGEDVELVCVSEQPLGFVRADNGQMEQVLMNLAVNARDAMPGGGQIRIALSNVQVDGRPFVQLAVSEIRLYGAGNFQVSRRLRAMIENLLESLSENRRQAPSL